MELGSNFASLAQTQLRLFPYLADLTVDASGFLEFTSLSDLPISLHTLSTSVARVVCLLLSPLSCGWFLLEHLGAMPGPEMGIPAVCKTAGRREGGGFQNYLC